MVFPLRMASLALVLLPMASQAQMVPTGAIGLEIPAPAPPSQGRFLTGAYVSGSYVPTVNTRPGGYAVQPYLRYLLGPATRTRLYVQYNFAPFWVQQAYGSTASPFGPGGVELPANPGFAPLGVRNAMYAGRNANYGGLGALSVGIPMQVGRSSAVLNVGGSVVEGLLWGLLR